MLLCTDGLVNRMLLALFGRNECHNVHKKRYSFIQLVFHPYKALQRKRLRDKNECAYRGYIAQSMCLNRACFGIKYKFGTQTVHKSRMFSFRQKCAIWVHRL